MKLLYNLFVYIFIEMTDLKNENKGLKERIQAMNNERGDLQMQVYKLQEELATEYRRFRDDCIEDINEMRAAEMADESKQSTMSGVSGRRRWPRNDENCTEVKGDHLKIFR